MKLKAIVAVELHRALRALDGHDKELYKFAGNTDYAIARTINHLRWEVEAIDRAIQKAIAKFTNGRGAISQTDENWDACQDELNRIQDAEIEVELHRFKRGDLNLDTNNIPRTVLAALMPVIIDDGAAKE